MHHSSLIQMTDELFVAPACGNQLYRKSMIAAVKCRLPAADHSVLTLITSKVTRPKSKKNQVRM